MAQPEFTSEKWDGEEVPCGECGRALYKVMTFSRSDAKRLVLCSKLARRDKVAFKIQPAEKSDKPIVKEIDDVFFTKEVGGTTDYPNVPRLRYWNFIGREELLWRTGIWQFKPFSVRFLRGDVRIARKLMIDMRTDEIVKASDETISFREAIADEWFEIGDYILHSLPSKFAPAGQQELPI